MCQGSGRQCIYVISLASGWIRPMESLCGDQRKREKENSGPFSSSLCCLGQRLAASLLRLQLPPCSPRLGDPGSSCPARPPPGGPDRSMVTPTPLFTPAPPPRGGSIFLPGVNRLITGSANMPPSASHLFHQETYRVPVLFQRNERKVCLGQRTPEALRPASPKPLSPLGEVSGEGRGYSCSQTHHGKESSSWPSSPTAHCWKHRHEERTQ